LGISDATPTAVMARAPRMSAGARRRDIEGNFMVGTS
jgi:hypothetical protein